MDERLLRATASIRGAVCSPAGTTLTIRRASDDGWELPGGRIREGEAVTDCLRRELTEEVAIDATVREPVHAHAWRNDDGDDRLAVYYHCSAVEMEPLLSDEHTEAEWVSEAVARERLSAPQTTAVARAIRADRRERTE
ncbi:NUDIX domain-containing protein [Halosimplex litoreum]|uniref:NUDIX domain-containing protein n=1 Tax=Halosimplex litoreum TaxID=1198301 RepID=A0A7T3KVH4_9EURY|nr:NUDIX domain-containing protein [Halosimplex litoreum]QPV62835.1 NUDIX domain-containing protein [Halosimplex litoreum]